MSAKPMNFENTSFMGHENQFMVFSWLFHGFFMMLDFIVNPNPEKNITLASITCLYGLFICLHNNAIEKKVFESN